MQHICFVRYARKAETATISTTAAARVLILMDSLLLSNGLSLIGTSAGLAGLALGPKTWRVSALWCYLVVVAGMCVGLMILGKPAPEVAGELECARALLAACVGLKIGMQAAKTSWVAHIHWVNARFQILCFVGCAWVLGHFGLNYLTTTQTHWGYRGVAMVDLAAAAVLLTTHARMPITAPLDRLVAQYLGWTYALYCAYRVMWEVGPAHAQFLGWMGTLLYVLTMLMIAAAALEEWAER